MSATGETSVWATNATIGEIAGVLRGAGSVLILTHVKPDGDAIGSTLALGRALASMGKGVTIAYVGPWPSRYDVVLGETAVLHADGATFADPPFGEPDAIVVLDTGARSQLDAACAYVEERAQKAVIVDHHAHGDAALAETRHIDTGAAAAAVLASVLVCELLGVEAKDLPREIAEPLFLGCATDTGWFKHPNVSPRCLRLCADLLEAGADHDWLFRATEQNDPASRLLLMRRALDSLTFHDNDRVAVMALLAKDFEETGASQDDSGGLIDVPKSIGAVRVSVLLTERGGRVKVSFRSKAGEGEVDVNRAAQSLGGGGHKHAAGATLDVPMDMARAAVLGALGITPS